jgi:SOS-response transcriptional repressor LexA
MEPIKSGSYIICEYLGNWEEIYDGKPYILISKDEGIVYKRLYNKVNESGEIVLKSDNPDYSPYTIKVEEIHEIWKALGFISFDLPEPSDFNPNKLYSMIQEMKNDIDKLKK